MTSNESRISNLEKEAMSLGARIEEAAADNAEELRAIRQDISQLGTRMDKSFDQAHAYIDHHMSELKATMATKDDMTAMEIRMSDSIDELKSLVMQLLQQKSGE